MSTPKRYMITAALPYANGPIHIGHLAGVYIPADIFSRFLRTQNKDVCFVCGSDEHGVPITIRAKKEGKTPQEIVDTYHTIIKNSLAQFHISFDEYSRTSSKVHYETASEFFLNLYNKNIFIEETSEQYYDEEENQFLADRYIIGTCPKCGNENAYGDQCEKCGSSLSPKELINPKSTLSGNNPILKETSHWYLPLDKYEDFLNDWIIKKHKNDWKTNVYGQVKSWLDAGLQPRAVTRDLDWGIPVPLPHAEGKVLYVWFDAPIGYISATKEWAEKTGNNWQDYWQDTDTELIHFIGKDNIVFHCIIFPVMLKAHGEYILPQNVPANEFLNLENDKISTSRNWAVWLHEYLEDFPGKGDVLRYVLTSNMPETKDNNFTWLDFQTKNNSELVGILGNFINRVCVLTHKYYQGTVPDVDVQEEENEMLQALEKSKDEIISHLYAYKFRDALQAYMTIARNGNKYLADKEPWKLIKDESQAEYVQRIMFVGLQYCGALALLGEIFLPETSQKLAQMLSIKIGDWSTVQPLLPKGHTIGEAKLLFTKIEDEEVLAQKNKLEQQKRDNQTETQNTSTMPEQKETIQFDDFQKLDLRVGKILTAQKVEKADKLLQFTVDTGLDTRTIVSGVAEHFSPEELVGKKVTVLLNLAPRKIRGIESQGMLLLAENAEGKLDFMTPEKDAAVGSIIS